jgi:hypothetical protein
VTTKVIAVNLASGRASTLPIRLSSPASLAW